VVIRPLRPDDFQGHVSTSTSDWHYGITAVTWDEVISSQTVADNRFIGINGISTGGNTVAAGLLEISNRHRDLVPLAQVRITHKGNLSRYWYVEPINNWENYAGYCDDPVIIDQNSLVTVETWGRTASSLTNWGLLGAVAEKRGLLINPLR
jgi:hypothetical protein